ncbi:MAG: hypothetical protein HeimC2_19680 [Candidatus Heimdallarchaeota archaeon LC_2]|nr:MAG: hypothetical protein HeimC2_19680 [Candidatus Heimdallarchaeota archaeon LC_2]
MGIAKAKIKALTKSELSRLFIDRQLNIILKTINTTEKGTFVVDFFIDRDKLKTLNNLGYEIYN